MRVATLAIGVTGGHGDLNGFSPYLRFEGFSGVADGVDAIRKMVRTNVTGTVSLAFLPEGGTPLRITKTGYDDLTIGVEIAPAKVEPITLVLVKRRPNPSD